MKNRKILIYAGLALLLSAASVGAQEKSWWDRFSFRKEAHVDGSSTTATPLVKPHPAVVNIQNSFAEIAAAVKPAVVNISAVSVKKVQQDQDQEYYFGAPDEFFYRFFGDEAPRRKQGRRPQEYRTEGTGSGVIIDAEGYILTNNHVVQGADELTVTLSMGKSYKGKVIGADPRSDLAVIKIKGSSPFPHIPLGDSSAMRVGDWVLAIGSPFGLEQTVTAGIISAIRQSLTIEGKSFRNLLQTDAAINRGNSGGPLVNIQGEVIGINTAIYAPTGVFSGIGFAIPINEAKSVLKDLIQKGFVERSWMGVEIAEVDDVMAQQFGLKNTEGALINQVVADSPAEKAGLKRGDVVVEFDGKKIETVQQLQDLVSSTPPKKSVKVRVLRDGSSQTVSLTTEALPKSEQTAGENEESDEKGKGDVPGQTKWLGATIVDATAALKRRFSDEDDSDDAPAKISGVILTDVPPESQASEAGLFQGDIIMGVNRQKIKNVADAKKAAVDFKKGVVFDVVRAGSNFYLTYKTPQ